MDFRQLRAFLTVAETGNVTRAAQLLNVVQPAVSRQIRLLEGDLGAILFVRERHGMVLTDAGRALVDHARRAMLELDRARAEVGSATGSPAGLVTIGLLPSTCPVVASALVGAVATRYPRIRMRIAMGYAGTLQQWLETGEIDAALLYGVDRISSLQTRPLVLEALWVVGPAGAGLKRHRPVALESLAGWPMIVPAGPLGIRTLVEHACAVSGIVLDIGVETNAMSVQKSLVIGGHGLTFLPPVAFADELRLGQVCAAPLKDPVITRTIVLALPGTRVVARHVHCVVDLLADIVRGAVDDGSWLEAEWVGGAAWPT